MKLNGVDQCQVVQRWWAGGKLERAVHRRQDSIWVLHRLQGRGLATRLSLSLACTQFMWGMPHDCFETAMGTVESDAADLAACAGVTSLADAAACDAVMKASDSTAKACTYATSTPPRRWSSAPCQAAGKVGEGWTKEFCDAMATPALVEVIGAPCDTHPSYCFLDNQCFLHGARKPYHDSYHDAC